MYLDYNSLKEGFYSVKTILTQESEIHYIFQEKGSWHSIKDGVYNSLQMIYFQNQDI